MCEPGMARIGPGPDPVGQEQPTEFGRKLENLIIHNARRQVPTLRSVDSGLKAEKRPQGQQAVQKVTAYALLLLLI